MAYIRLEKYQFSFRPIFHGSYSVAYFTPKGFGFYVAQIDDMDLIDAVHSCDYPTQKAMQRLRGAVIEKSRGYSRRVRE